MAEQGSGERKAWVDMGKGIAMYFVMLFHSEYYLPVSQFEFSPFVGYFNMPFFFFLSGYLFTSDYRHLSLRRKMGQVACRMVWTYLVFTTIIWLPKSMANGSSAWEGFRDILLGYASWFIVTLALSHTMWAIMVRLTKDQRVYVAMMAVSIVVGGIIKVYHLEPLPYWFDRALLANFFLGLGFFYRQYEPQVARVARPSVSLFVLLAVAYIIMVAIDKLWLGGYEIIFAPGDHHVFTYTLACSLLGIAMMTVLVQIVRAPKALCFIGVNSLTFYYLNGGVIRVLSMLSDRCGLTLAITDGAEGYSYIFTLLLSIVAALVIAFIAKAINRFAPILTGDRQAILRSIHYLSKN